MKIKKRLGSNEEFSEQKPKNSMMKAGASEKTAKAVSFSIKPHQGITTSEVRKNVMAGLRKHEPDVAIKYEGYKKK